MLSSSSPYKLTVAFAESGDKNTIPLTGDAAAGVAAYDTGFPPVTMLPLASGGIPPDGMDMNGILYALSNAARWSAAMGLYTYDSTFQAAIGGYPAGAIVRNLTHDGLWLSTHDNNLIVPGGANYNDWIPLAWTGVLTKTLSAGGQNLTALEVSYPLLNFTNNSTLTATAFFPERPGRWLIHNAVGSSGSVSVRSKNGSITHTLPPGTTGDLYAFASGAGELGFKQY